MVAASDNNEEVVAALLLSGASVNLETARGRTALTHAAELGEADDIELLVRGHADPNYETTTGMTALIAAAGAGQAESTSALVHIGADLDQETRKGNTALIEACRTGSVLSVVALCALKANPQYESAVTGYTAMMVAAGGGEVDAIHALVEAKASVSHRGRCNLTALEQATLCGHQAATELLGRYQSDETPPE